ncbi:hypothetical protein CPAR01_14395 [Colletotrichum paranaense]|uniref:Uncharacterized protein n=1 Tax=Colletotrichum paranaense TaxID=1914294 RepID=A0ABQ9S223_9PEZI|nr:uncharacterized protein CPAR01_14395 [Colletotrichum paranaense]KAK1522852.1 hypothetical protein CPAR01_14395 [Colletotrichum paranaense]
MRASSIAKGYTFYLGTGPTMTAMVQHDGASETGSYELTTFIEDPGLGHATVIESNLFTVVTSSMCSMTTIQVCDPIEVTHTLSVSEPTETAGTTTSILESASSSSAQKTSTSSEIKGTSSTVSMTGTGTQTVVTPTASSEASQTEIMVFCAIAGAIIMYFL